MVSRINYKPSIISYLDILGFKNIVDNFNETEIRDILESFKRWSETDKELKSSLEMKLTNFSDTIVRSTNIISKGNRSFQDGILYNELLDLTLIQCSLIEKGVLIRGSVVIGQISHTKDYIFGPGLNKAYQLENDIAIFPRIIIDPLIINDLEEIPLLKRSGHTTEEEKKYLKGFISESNDGLWYLDYLKGMSRLALFKNYLYLLEDHKKLILNLSDKYNDIDNFDKLSQKIGWLVKYHNNVVNSIKSSFFKEEGVKKKSYLISQKECPTLVD